MEEKRMKQKIKNTPVPVLAAILVCIVAFTWCLYDSTVDRSGWADTKKGVRYKDFHGHYVTGWQEIDGKRYYFGTDALLVTGWQEIDGNRYFFTDSGEPATGWTQIDGSDYCFSQEGAMRTGWVDGRYLTEAGTPASGWLEDLGSRYYLGDNGKPITGRSLVDGKIYYFQENGMMLTGWAYFSGFYNYFTESGVMAVGLTEIDGSLYYFNESGAMQTGWLELGEYRYYLHEDGKAAVEPTQIDGETHYFTPKGIHVMLVNPWHYLPDGYRPELAKTVNGHFVDTLCVEALEQMLADCEAAGFKPTLASSYRPHSTQVMLYERKVKYWKEQGHSESYARKLAGTSVAVPGTSEHQLGLAVDIVDSKYTNMDRKQSETATQKWLMEHCWEYGFILRFLDGTSEITGIIYEPWHYRYVGTKVSLEMKELGITLEEYLGAMDHVS